MNTTDARLIFRTIVLFGLGLLATLILLIGVGVSTISGLHSAVKRVQETQLHACIANNVQTALNNSSHVADEGVDDFIAKRFLIPTKTETAAQKKTTAEFASKIEDAVITKTWQSLDDCNAPPGNTGEVSVHSIAQQAPPWYVLAGNAKEILNAIKPDPYGSINLKPHLDLGSSTH